MLGNMTVLFLLRVSGIFCIYTRLVFYISIQLTVCSYDVTYTFQSESTLYSCLNVKKLLAWHSISIQFSNAVVTVRNESRKTLEYLMHFCSSSHYVMWQAFYSLSHPHILVTIFSIVFWGVFSSSFFSRFSTGQLFTSFKFLHFEPSFV